MTRYPLLFTYTDVVEGEGYTAHVVAAGRATLTDDGVSIWVDGVNPGAIADGGDSPGEALSRFRVTYKAILLQFAQEESDFQLFKARVQRFFDDTDAATVADWLAAVAEVRSGAVTAPLPKKNADEAYIGVDVTQTAGVPSAGRGFVEITPAIAA